MIDERLSAFLDDECDAAEARRSIQALQNEPGYRRAWQRQLWTREALRSDGAVPVYDPGFADRVLAGLEAGATHTDTVVPLAGRRRRRWRTGAGGLALAASVAAAVVLVVSPYRIGTPGEGRPAPVSEVDMIASQMQRSPAQSSLTAVVNPPPAAAPIRGPHSATNRWSVGDPVVAERLNSYLLEHSGLAGGYGVSGARPSFIRMVTYGWSSGR